MQELSNRLAETALALAERTKEVSRLEESEERLRGELKEKEQELRTLADRLRNAVKSGEEKLREANERLSFEVENAEKTKQAL